jgi:predicted permease
MGPLAAAVGSTIQDIRYGARLLWRSPWFTLVAILSLAVGLGSGVALFTFMNAVLYRPLPGRGTADIYTIHTSNRDGGRYGATSFADFQSFTRATPPLFAATCATTRVKGNIDAGQKTRSLAGAVMSGGCFDALKVRPHVGRLLSRSDDVAGSEPPAVVISYALWRRAFGGDARMLGRGVLVNGVPAVVVGVAEQGFAGLSLDAGADFWAPAALAPVLDSPEILTNRGDRRFRVYVRLNDGVTSSRAADQLSVVAAQLRAEDPETWTETSGSTRTVTLTREIDSRFAGGSANAATEIALLLLSAIAAVVAIACVNLATMIVARGIGRTRELNLRLALGASRWRLLRQLATESLLISAAGAIGGVFVVSVALRLFEQYRPAEIPAFNLAVDWRVASFAALMAIVTPVVFGVAPGAHALRLAIAQGLKNQTVWMRRRFLLAGPRELLLLVQVTVSFALLIMAALFMRSLVPVESAHVGVPAQLVAIVPVDLNTAARSDAERRTMTDRLLRAAEDVPGVERATAAAIVPMTGSYFGIGGRLEDRADAAATSFDGNIVAPGYFEIAGIAQRAGRTFVAGDRENAPLVAVVSESLARQLWDTTAVLGRSIRLDDGPRQVVGVVADTPYRSTTGAPQPVLYLPLAQAPRQRMVLHAHVRSTGEAAVALDRALRAVDARVVVGTAMSLEQFLDLARAPGRVTQWIGVVAGLLQLGLALMAIWGLVTYAVERRTAEMAIRRALGATEGSIVQLLMRPSAWLVGVGAVLGCGVGVVAAEILHAEIVGLAPLDLSVVMPAALLVGAVVVIAVWLPARRAVAIEPAAALKQN